MKVSTPTPLPYFEQAPYLEVTAYFTHHLLTMILSHEELIVINFLMEMHCQQQIMQQVCIRV